MTDTEYAVVDIGSNSLRLMQGIFKKGQWRFYPKRLATTRLAKGLNESGHLSPEGIVNSFAVMEEWNRDLQGIPVCAVATSAVREARDGQAFLAEVRWRFGWHCRIASGAEEAGLFQRSLPVRLSPFLISAGAVRKWLSAKTVM